MQSARKSIKSCVRCAFAIAALSLAAPSLAEWKPETNVEYFVPAGPGGAVDTYARIIGKIMDAKGLLNGEQLIVQNKPGGAGMIATGELFKRPGNGHVFTLYNNGYIISTLLGDFRYDLQKDFTMGPVLYQESMGVAVSYDSPIRTAKDLIETLKKDPSRLRIGVAPSLVGNIYMSIAYPLLESGIDLSKLTVAPFRSSAETMVALRGNHIDVMAGSVANMLDALASKHVRVIAVTSAERLAGPLAEVPTWKEQGVDISFGGYNGVLFPKDMSTEQMAYWENVFKTVSESDAWQELLDRYQLEATYIDHTAAKDFLAAQFEQTTALMKRLNISKAPN